MIPPAPMLPDSTDPAAGGGAGPRNRQRPPNAHTPANQPATEGAGIKGTLTDACTDSIDHRGAGSGRVVGRPELGLIAARHHRDGLPRLRLRLLHTIVSLGVLIGLRVRHIPTPDVKRRDAVALIPTHGRRSGLVRGSLQRGWKCRGRGLLGRSRGPRQAVVAAALPDCGARTPRQPTTREVEAQ